MCARSDADIVAAAPIDKIMPRLRQVARVVRHFICGQTGGIANLLGQIIHIRTRILVRQAG